MKSMTLKFWIGTISFLWTILLISSIVSVCLGNVERAIAILLFGLFMVTVGIMDIIIPLKKDKFSEIWSIEDKDGVRTFTSRCPFSMEDINKRFNIKKG